MVDHSSRQQCNCDHAIGSKACVDFLTKPNQVYDVWLASNQLAQFSEAIVAHECIGQRLMSFSSGRLITPMGIRDILEVESSVADTTYHLMVRCQQARNPSPE